MTGLVFGLCGGCLCGLSLGCLATETDASAARRLLLLGQVLLGATTVALAAMLE